MKTASIKYETKSSIFNFVMEKINKHEIAFNVGFRSFFFCLL